MTVSVIVGAQWGDEGKGKIVDLLTPDVDLVVRFQGGANAGHTLVVNGEATVLHLLPSGVLHAHVVCVIGNGVVLDPAVCLQEIAMCASKGLSLQGRLHIGATAHVVLPHHVHIDTLREVKQGAQKIGTTKRGIGPAYEAKAARRGLLCGDLVEPDRLIKRLHDILPDYNAYITQVLGGTAPNVAETVETYAAYGEQLRPYVTDTVSMLHDAVAAKKHILFEGAQGTALDVDHGTYPFVTSSSTVSAGACTGSGVGPTVIDEVLGVAKAYCTRVGEGPFPTELHDEIGKRLQSRGGEFGATTGRPRRCGWFDAVALRRAAQLNGLTGMAITKVDVLEGFDTINVCTGYQRNGVALDAYPTRADVLASVEPIYEEYPGWRESCQGATTRSDLPINLQSYLARLEALVGVPVRLLSFGPDRNDHLQL